MSLKQICLGLFCLLVSAHCWTQSPPPRSARDVTALLDSYQPDSQRIAALEAELARQAPPEDSLKSTQIEYSQRRAAVAEALGLFAIEMAARRKLVALTRGREEGQSHLRALASREFWVGSFAEGVRLTEVQHREATNKSLLVVPHGPAAMIPFAVLTTAATDASARSQLLFTEYRSAPWLVRQVSITQLPSVNALVTLRAQPPAKAGRLAFAGFGDPIFDLKQTPQGKTEVSSRGFALYVRSAAQTTALASARLANLPRLPDTADEIRGLAQMLGASEADSV